MSKQWLFLMLIALSFYCLADVPRLTLKRANTQAWIDGELDEPCWSTAEKIQLSYLLGQPTPPSQRTDVLLTYDDSHIYIAFICYEEKMDKIVARQKQRDKDVWRDDCLEVFLAPNPPTYFHFILNTLGIQQDEVNKDAKWNGEWRAKVKKFPDRWQAEIAIPFSSLPFNKETPSEWRANFCRNETPYGELSSWTQLERSFHEPTNFGIIAFSSPPPFADIAEEQIKEAKEKWQVYLKDILKEVRGKREEIAQKIREEVEQALGDLEKGTIDPRYFNPAYIELLVEKFKLGEGENSPYLVCWESTLNKIRKDKPYSGKSVTEITIYCARNERRATQLVISPLRKGLKNVQVSWGKFKGKGGEIGSENISLNLVGYVEVKEPTKDAEPGIYPDPLLPYSPFDVPLESIQPLWLTIYVPPSAKGGWYEGWLEIKPSNAPSKRIKIRLYAFNFSLPTRSTLKTCFLLNTSYLPKYHRVLSGSWGWFESPPVRWDSDALSLSEDAEQGRYALQAPPTDLRWNNILSPFQGTCDENTYISFAYKSNDEGVTFALFGTPVGNKFFTPKEQVKGKWQKASVKLVDCGVPVGSSFTIQFVHDFEGGSHSFLIDEVEVYREKNGERNVLYKEDFENFSREKFSDLVRKYRLNMLEHRVSDCNIVAPHIEVREGKVEMDWGDFDREIGFYVDRGLNGFNINWLRIPSGWGEVGKLDPQQVEISAEIIRQTERHLSEKGWLKLGYIYTIDEPSKEHFPTIREIFSFVKENGPHLRRLLTFGYGATRPWMPGEKGLPAYSEIADYVDILVPHSDCFDYPYLKLLKEKNKDKEIWMYVCISAQKPYPNIWAIDYPGIDHRILFWQCRKFDVEGFLYWCVNYWEKNPWQDTQTYPGGNGDGSLLYPGEEGPVSSIRWEIIREGIQDYDYLSLLEAKVGKEKAKRWLDGIVENLTQYTQDPQRLEQRRIEIGKILEAYYVNPTK